MITIDYDSLRKQVLFAIQHYGTRTQGEEYRQEQVSAHITEMVIRLNEAYQAASSAEASDISIVVGLA